MRETSLARDWRRHMVRRGSFLALILALPVIAAGVVGLGAVAVSGPSGVSALLAGPSEAAVGGGGSLGAPSATALSEAIGVAADFPLAPADEGPDTTPGGGNPGPGDSTPGPPNPGPGPGPGPDPGPRDPDPPSPPQPPPPEPPPSCRSTASCTVKNVTDTTKPIIEPLPAPLAESIRETVDGVGRSVDALPGP